MANPKVCFECKRIILLKAWSKVCHGCNELFGDQCFQNHKCEPKEIIKTGKYDVDISWRMDKTIYGIEAENEEDAIKKAGLMTHTSDGEYVNNSLTIDEIRIAENLVEKLTKTGVLYD